MIIIKNLSKSYKTKFKNNLVFEKVNLSIKEGDKIALIGRNGAGKSTFLRLLGGVESCEFGQIKTNNKISWPIGSKEGFHPLLTARENVTFISKIYLGNDIKELIKKIKFVENFAEIGQFFDKPYRNISSGMKTRVSFGISMAFDFDFYLIDELSSAGDLYFREKSKFFLDKKLKNSGFIMIDHNLKNIQNYCQKAFVIHNKRIKNFDNLSKAIDFYKKNLKDIN